MPCAAYAGWVPPSLTSFPLPGRQKVDQVLQEAQQEPDSPGSTSSGHTEDYKPAAAVKVEEVTDTAAGGAGQEQLHGNVHVKQEDPAVKHESGHKGDAPNEDVGMGLGAIAAYSSDDDASQDSQGQHDAADDKLGFF